MNVNKGYIKGKNNEVISPIVSVDTIFSGDIKLVDFFYPVGTYYETSDPNFNPNIIWGGTWVEDTQGETLISRDTTYNEISKSVGSNSVSLTSDNLPSHSHTYNKPSTNTSWYTLTLNDIPAHSHGIRLEYGYMPNQSDISDKGIRGVLSKPDTKGGFAIHGSLTQEAYKSYQFVTGNTEYDPQTYPMKSEGGGDSHRHGISTTSTFTGSTGSGIAISTVQKSKICVRWHRIG